MKSKALFLVTILLPILIPSISPKSLAQAQPSKIKSFAQWCKEKDLVPPETQDTINFLLQRVGTTDCQLANARIDYVTSLNLSSFIVVDPNANPTVDLRPLEGLTNLTYLDLAEVWISDLNPISNLTKLTYLDIRNNRIVDIKPLANLTNLTYLNLSSLVPIKRIARWEERPRLDLKPLINLRKLTRLDLGGNEIVDIKPLASLTSLTDINLSDNQIFDLNPLSRLTNLRYITLGGNRIVDISPLTSLKELTYLEIARNQITSFKKLSTLTNLKSLELDGNRVIKKNICPVKPKTVCRFSMPFNSNSPNPGIPSDVGIPYPYLPSTPFYSPIPTPQFPPVPIQLPLPSILPSPRLEDNLDLKTIPSPLISPQRPHIDP